MKVIIVGSGVAGSEAGTYLGQNAKIPLEIIEIESEPRRRFGGWGFQKFPGENTNLAMRKMYLGRDPEDIFRWSKEQYPDRKFNPDETFPRALMQEYVKWRRNKVNNRLVYYKTITDEATKVSLMRKEKVNVKTKNGCFFVSGDRLVMASGSISVKVPEYIDHYEDKKLIVDPLAFDGHIARTGIKPNESVLVLGTGLTGEEQANVLLKRGHKNITLFSRSGKRHFPYPKEQTNLPLKLEEPPSFLYADTPEEFNKEMGDFFAEHLNEGRSPEDIFAAIRPFWEQMRADLGGCYKAADRLRKFRRELAVNSIGCPWEVSETLRKGEAEGKVSVIRGNIKEVSKVGDQWKVVFDDKVLMYDWIINAVGRNIIRHSIWEQLLEDGIAKKHAGIGVRVSDTGRMVSNDESESDLIWVVGMARAGDHALRHGFLGNTAFNVPMVRSHLYDTMDDLLTTLHCPYGQRDCESLSGGICVCGLPSAFKGETNEND